MRITQTDVGPAIIIIPRLASIGGAEHASHGSIALALLLHPTTKLPLCYSLVWAWGGDWTGFGDGECDDADKLDGWEPEAIREAIREINRLPLNEAVSEDMEWFANWADRAEETMMNDDSDK